MKQFFLLMLTLVCLKLSAQPEQISFNEAKTAAIARVASQTMNPRSNITILETTFYQNGKGDVLLYEIETDKGITVLLSGNRKCKPILGVHNNADGLLLNKYDSLPCGMKYLIDYYKNQVNHSFQDSNFNYSSINEWHNLLTGEQQSILRTGCVPPLLTSLWSQQDPSNGVGIDAYNYLMPSGNNCDHCLAGCVAVAMGQVMYYWKHPVLMNAKLLQKVEELTLYVIDLQKQIEEMKSNQQ